MNTCCRGDINFRTTLSGTSESKETCSLAYFISFNNLYHLKEIRECSYCLPSSSCLPSGEGVQSSRLFDRLSSTASPTDERRLCSAASPLRSLRFRSRCSADGVPPAFDPAPPSSAPEHDTAAHAPPTDDRRDTSSRYCCHGSRISLAYKLITKTY